jgi:hypothetical protein
MQMISDVQREKDREIDVLVDDVDSIFSFDLEVHRLKSILTRQSGSGSNPQGQRPASDIEEIEACPIPSEFECQH